MAVVPVPRLRNFMLKELPLKTEQQEEKSSSPASQSSISQQERNQKVNASEVTLIGSLRAQVSFLIKQRNQSSQAIDKVTALERENANQLNTNSKTRSNNALLQKEHEEILAKHRDLGHKYSALVGLTQKLVQANREILNQISGQVSEDELKFLKQLLAAKPGSSSTENLEPPSLVTPPPTPLMDTFSFPQSNHSSGFSIPRSGEPLQAAITHSSPSSQEDSSDDAVSDLDFPIQPNKRILAQPPRPYKRRRFSDGLFNVTTPNVRKVGSGAIHLNARNLQRPSTLAPSDSSLSRITSQSSRIRTCQRCLSTECPGRIRRRMCESLCWRCGHKECTSVTKGLHKCTTV